MVIDEADTLEPAKFGLNGARVEVAAQEDRFEFAPRLATPGEGVHCHVLGTRRRRRSALWCSLSRRRSLYRQPSFRLTLSADGWCGHAGEVDHLGETVTTSRCHCQALTAVRCSARSATLSAGAFSPAFSVAFAAAFSASACSAAALAALAARASAPMP